MPQGRQIQDRKRRALGVAEAFHLGELRVAYKDLTNAQRACLVQRYPGVYPPRPHLYGTGSSQDIPAPKTLAESPSISHAKSPPKARSKPHPMSSATASSQPNEDLSAKLDRKLKEAFKEKEVNEFLATIPLKPYTSGTAGRHFSFKLTCSQYLVEKAQADLKTPADIKQIIDTATIKPTSRPKVVNGENVANATGATAMQHRARVVMSTESAHSDTILTNHVTTTVALASETPADVIVPTKATKSERQAKKNKRRTVYRNKKKSQAKEGSGGGCVNNSDAAHRTRSRSPDNVWSRPHVRQRSTSLNRTSRVDILKRVARQQSSLPDLDCYGTDED
ncbi:MAG: hypothetical protein Q9181_008065 [Wetmoreana brouardii]